MLDPQSGLLFDPTSCKISPDRKGIRAEQEQKGLKGAREELPLLSASPLSLERRLRSHRAQGRLSAEMIS